jgi:ribosome maturation factor RimP
MSTFPLDHSSTIKTLASQVVEGTHNYVVDVEIKGGAGNPLIWVYLDVEQGQASIEDCTRVSRELKLLMEAHEVYSDGNYTLNVSTPGLSRPLQDVRQYKNNIGRQAKVKTRENENTIILEGKIVAADDQAVQIQTKKNTVSLAYSQILETKIIPVFK